jgi:hypothetical protein
MALPSAFLVDVDAGFTKKYANSKIWSVVLILKIASADCIPSPRTAFLNRFISPSLM